MASETDFPSRGKVISVADDHVVFAPANTTYQLHLRTPRGRYDGPVNTLVDGVIRVNGRKVYTVPSGGNFVTPIVGPPKIAQGRVRHIEDRYLVLHAGVTLLIKFPESDNAVDLVNGPIQASALVNATLLPGATFELLGAVVPA